ncbi:MAG: hypothetical protein J4G16_13705, partial [Acidobacteria bacterium]|nr:hypothetical protein [Acidobacteriota bacterium]
MKRLVRSVGIALLMASGDSLAAWTRGVQPPQPPIAVTGASTGAQTATGTPGGQTPAQQPAD